MDDRNGGAIMAIGGLVTVVVIAAWAAKIIRNLFLELGKTLDAFGVMMHSFVGFLWATAQVAFLVSLIGASIAAAIYFTYKYISMVKRATEIQKAVALRIAEQSYALDTKLQEFESSVEQRLHYMSAMLNKALKEPEAAPVATPSEPAQVLLPTATSEVSEARDVSEQVTTINQGDTDTDMSAVSPTL